MKKNKIQIAIAASLSIWGGHDALAQAQQAATTGLEEITVTATRRVQNMQEVPISVVAITGDNLVARGLDNLEKVSQGVPNVVITGGTGGTGGTTFRMRGIPNVGTYIDNVWQVGTAGFLTQEFVDIDRVEVLRGPQGTMFGRDSTGGAIRIWTKRPAEELGGNITATVGNYDRMDIKGSIDLPVSDAIRTKWTLANMSRDGYIKSLTTGQFGGGVDQQVMRGDIVWDATETLSFRANYQSSESEMTEPRVQDAMFRTYNDPNPNWPKILVGLPEFYTLVGTDSRGQSVEPFFVPANQVAGHPGGRVGEWENRSNSTLPNRYETNQASLEASWQATDDITVVFLTSKVTQDADSVVDWDNSQYDLVTDINRSALEMTSNELQVTGTLFDRFEWMTGLYNWDQTIQTRNGRWQANEFQRGLFPIANVLTSAACNPVGGTPAGYQSCASVWAGVAPGAYDTSAIAEQDGWAGFGEVTMHVTSKLDLTLGMRHHDQQGYSQNLARVAGVSAAKPLSPDQYHVGDAFAGNKVGVPNKFAFQKNTLRGVAQYIFNENFNVYASYSEGFNSGGISAPVINGVRTEIPFKPSTLENTEFGIRSDLFDNRLRVNFTVFSTIWVDLQAAGVVIDPVTKVQLPQLVTTNVGEAEAKGFELEITYVPTDNLLLTFAGGKLDTAYTDIQPGTMTGHLPLNSGTEFAAAPDSSYTFGAQYTTNLSGGSSLISRVDYNYQGQFWRSEPFLRVDGYAAVPDGFEESGDWGVTNMRMTYQPADADWQVSLFGTNITDEYMINSGFFHGVWGFDFATVSRPREYGVSFEYRL